MVNGFGVARAAVRLGRRGLLAPGRSEFYTPPCNGSGVRGGEEAGWSCQGRHELSEHLGEHVARSGGTRLMQRAARLRGTQAGLGAFMAQAAG